jgi:hypothetical protein
MAGLNMDLNIDYLLRWHSTALENGYYSPSGTGDAFPMVIISGDGESLFDQAARMAKALVPDYILTCNRNGELRVIVDPMLQEIADRTAVSQASIGASNWLGVNWERMRPPRIHWNWGEAIVASSSEITAVFCTAPGETPGQGLSSVTSGYQLTQSQETLNANEGHRYGRSNAVNGLIPVRLAVDPGADPADMTWVTLTVPDAYTRRKIGFSAARCLVDEVNISYEYSRTGLVTRVELLLEEETSGTPAVTYVPPNPDWEPPIIPPIEPPPPGPIPQGTGFGTLYLWTNGVLGRTRAFSADSPTYSNITPSGTFSFRDFILDPHSPSTTAYHLSVGTNGGVRKSTNMDEATPTWSLVLTIAAIETATSGTVSNLFLIRGSINQLDYIGFLAYVIIAGGTIFVFIYSENGGTSWNYSTITAFATGFSSWDIVPHTIGGSLTLYAYLHRNNDSYIYKSTNKGATWAYVDDFGLASGDRTLLCHCPYEGNTDGLLLFLAYLSPGTDSGAFFKSTDGGATRNLIADPSDGMSNEGTRIGRNGIEAYTEDSDLLFWWTAGDDGLYTSIDGGANWTLKSATGLTGEPVAAGGFPYNGQQYYVVTTTGIFVSVDGGNSFVNKTGDWSFGFTASGSEPYHNIIVPDWTE